VYSNKTQHDLRVQLLAQHASSMLQFTLQLTDCMADIVKHATL